MPICFFDVETTGKDTKTDRIIEIAVVRLDNNDITEQYHSLVNPEMPISAAAAAVHGINDADVQDAPRFAEIAKKIASLLYGCDIGGYNSNNFDIPILYRQMVEAGYNQMDLKHCAFIDACTIFKRKEERTLSAAVRRYLGREHTGAHSAIDDVMATIDVFRAQRREYPDIMEMDRLQLDLYCNNDKPRLDISGCFTVEAGIVKFNFGKHHGEPAANHKSFLEWMLSSNFLPDTKNIVHSLLNS